jgi:hypothetical protein
MLEPAMRLVLVVLSFFVVGSLYPATTDFQYSRSKDLRPLKLSYDDLLALLSKAHSLLSTANGAEKGEYLEEAITISTGADEMKIPGFSWPASTRLPNAAYNVSYRYSWSDARVSLLQLDLGDSYRKITVSGRALDQVEAICSSLERDMSERSTFVGGSSFRDLSGLILWTIFVNAFIWTGAYCIVQRRWRAIGMPLFSLLGLILLFTLPFDELFPGFAVYRGDASFLVRYAPHISFLGLVITTVAIPLSYFLAPRNRASRK